jgi:hypothetical protein
VRGHERVVSQLGLISQRAVLRWAVTHRQPATPVALARVALQQVRALDARARNRGARDNPLRLRSAEKCFTATTAAA